jgi:hypothetical protein
MDGRIEADMSFISSRVIGSTMLSNVIAVQVTAERLWWKAMAKFEHHQPKTKIEKGRRSQLKKAQNWRRKLQ